jgi:predicted acyl esterase
MGANEWRHAPSFAAAANGRLRLYLSPARAGGRYTLRDKPAATNAAVVHSVDLSDRTDADARRGGGLLDTQIDTANAVVFVSEPLTHALEVNGLLSGHLELVATKRDFDFSVTLYELTADGQYFQLPPYTSRASHVANLSVRRLLTPGTRERLDFRSHLRPVSRRIGAGSRFVAVLAVVKNAGQQINYGSGKPVSEESIADARDPVTIRWLGGSYIDLPTRHQAGANNR